MTYLKFLLPICLGFLFLGQPAVSQTAVSIRVNIAESLQQAQLSANEKATVMGLKSIGWQHLGQISSNTPLEVQANNGYLNLKGALQQSNLLGLKIQLQNQGQLGLNQAWYRGQFELKMAPDKSHFYVINQLPLEHYLYSVIPSEMPASWPLEALKSQAVAARTYAISHLGTYRQAGYDVKATTSSQVYHGVKSETSSSYQAVKQTQAEILTYQNKPIHAYFHANSGGKTEDGSALWAPFPYLKSVPDFDQKAPKYTWFQEYSQNALQAGLKKMDVNLGDILRIEIATFTESGRVKTLRIFGKRSSQTIKAAKFRLALGLNSTFFNVGNIDSQGNIIASFDPQIRPQSFQFAGRGWGHGLGLSQWGARQMAINGSHYKEILAHYYKDVQIKPLHASHFKLVSHQP